MKLKVISTGSDANSYILEPSASASSAIAIEAGCGYMEAAKAMDFDTSRLRALFISHEHGDHSKKVSQWVKAGIQVVASEGTAEKIGLKEPGVWYTRIKAGGKSVRVGDWLAVAFHTAHDAAEPVGFLFRHPEKKVLFLTDSGRIQLVTNNVDCFIVECNWTFAELSAGNDPPSLKRRIMETHTGLETLKEFFAVQGMAKAGKIVLIHSSSRNCDIDRAVREIEAQTGIPTYAARKGDTINF